MAKNWANISFISISLWFKYSKFLFLNHLGRGHACAEDQDMKSGNTQKNEASITELLVKMVDKSIVFFSQDINPKKHLWCHIGWKWWRHLISNSHFKHLFAISKEPGTLLAIRIWFHWLKFSTPPKDRAQDPLSSHVCWKYCSLSIDKLPWSC